MCCVEALGCAALMVSDKGNYPEGMVDSKTMLTYGCATDARRRIETALHEPAYAREVAARGYQMIRDRYSKLRRCDIELR
jgi:spore maturation protein CgeB